MKRALAVGLALSAVISIAQPAAELKYTGNVEGLPGQVTMQFRDIRTAASGTPGFYIIGGRPAWILFDALTGYIEVGAQLTTPTANYLFAGEFYGAWAYVEVINTFGTERIQSRVDFATDGNYVYLDQFQLTANPLGPGPVAYYFTMDPLPPDPNTRPADLGPVEIILSPERAPKIEWKSTPGWRYRVLYKDNLAASTWSLLGEVVAAGGTASLEDKAAGGRAQRFYYVELQ